MIIKEFRLSAAASVIAAIVLVACTTSARASTPYNGIVLYPLAKPLGYTTAVPSQGPQAAFGGQVVGYGYGSVDHALLWTGLSPVKDLQPNLAGITGSNAISTNGTEQVGYGISGGIFSHALRWTGTAGSAVDLNPSGFSSSSAFGTDGNQQVGEGYGSPTNNVTHALLWTGTAASVIDLNPSGMSGSHAFGIKGGQQVGYGVTGNGNHALLWYGTAGSAIDLNPNGFDESQALGTNGSQQVGFGDGSVTSGYTHAVVWSGTANSAIDLQPSNIIGASYATGTNGFLQVGYGTNSVYNYNFHALAWTGTAASMIDLHTLLPAAGSWITSHAYGVDSDGNIFGTADGTLNGVTGSYAVEWSPAPEPTTFLLALTCGALWWPVVKFTRKKPAT